MKYYDVEYIKSVLAFHQSEIYCPHEGIDRTAEVGVSLDWS